MVEIPTARVANYVQQPNPRTSAFLLHGTDPGLIRAHGSDLLARLVETYSESPEVLRLGDDELLAEPDLLTVEAQTSSMFSPGKILRLQVSGRSITNLAKFAWADVPASVRIIVEAGNLKKDASLRKIFEKSADLVALPCHEADGNPHVARLARQEMTAAGLRMTREAEQHLVNLLDVDLGVAKSEITKLITYASDSAEITVEDVDAVIDDAGQSTLDTAADAILAGDAPFALNQMEKLRASGTPPDVLLNVVLQHMMRLLRLRGLMDAGNSADTALKAFRPPLHFRRAKRMTSQIRSWDRQRLESAIAKVLQAQCDARLKADLGHQIAADLIFRLSQNEYRAERTKRR